MHFFVGNKEERLARRLQDGESQALREYYTLYADYLTGVCARYVKNDEDLKDVLQEAFLQMISHIKDFRYRGAGSLQAWSKKVAVNESLKYLRQRHRHEFERLDEDVVDEEEVDDPDIKDIPSEVLHQMIRELPTGYRTVFNLYVFENKSHQEIAELLGIKKDTSCSQFSRAKNLLAKKITAYNHSKLHPR